MLQGTLKDFLNAVKRMWVVFIVRIIHSLHHIMSHQSHAHTQCEHELTTAHTAAADLLYACAFAMERIISGCINTTEMPIKKCSSRKINFGRISLENTHKRHKFFSGTVKHQTDFGDICTESNAIREHPEPRTHLFSVAVNSFHKKPQSTTL